MHIKSIYEINIDKLKKAILAEDQTAISDLTSWFLDQQACEALIPLYRDIAIHSIKSADAFEETLWRQAFQKEEEKVLVKCFALGFIGNQAFTSTVNFNDILKAMINYETHIELSPKWYEGQDLLDAMPSRYRGMVNEAKFGNLNPLVGRLNSLEVCLGANAPTLTSKCLVGTLSSNSEYNDQTKVNTLQHKLESINPAWQKIKIVAYGNPIDVAIECETAMDLYGLNVWLEQQNNIERLVISRQGDWLNFKTETKNGDTIAETAMNGIGVTGDALQTYLNGHVKNIYWHEIQKAK